jgi:hypothetical protein
MSEIIQSQVVTKAELEAFVAAVSARHNAGLRAAYPDCELNWETISAQPGRKYARLVTAFNGESRSAFAFVDLSNGDILKCAGWGIPAKHARGNIRVGDASNLWNGAFINNGGGLFTAYLR